MGLPGVPGADLLGLAAFGFADGDGVAGVSRVRQREPAGGPSFEVGLCRGALPTGDRPGGDVVRVVAGVTVVVEGELLEGAVPGV